MHPKDRQHNAAAAINVDGEGDSSTFCGTCAFASVCLPQGYDKSALADLHCLIDHVGPYAAGQHIFRIDDPFGAIYAVRAGTVKTYTVDDLGREQVIGFYLPGELIGLSSIYASRHPCNAVALDSVTLCRFAFPEMESLALRVPGVQQQLFRLLSKEIGMATLLTGDYSVDERLAAFLINIADRHAARGYSARRFRLTMSRADIANYLHIAAETVSRVLRRLQNDGVVRVDGREVEICDRVRLHQLARCVLRLELAPHPAQTEDG